MGFIKSVENIVTIEKANEVVEILNSEDDDWTYEVVELGNGLAKVGVKDEDGFFLGHL
tara:strand:+ start:75 stop:248 length:174 start_codon:yes stop_codon:yes gene_type:complete